MITSLSNDERDQKPWRHRMTNIISREEPFSWLAHWHQHLCLGGIEGRCIIDHLELILFGQVKKNYQDGVNGLHVVFVTQGSRPLNWMIIGLIILLIKDYLML
ncbi:unnamed protein product [Ilex paraguariensis]|uniref:Uncharacterized protein n=1 Tax=Ilex paraguariensis TaxID=185542 RepID=A0ABC8UCY4_9AQUA